MKKAYLFVFIMLCSAAAGIAEDKTWAYAASLPDTIRWTGAAGDNVWDNPGNWDAGRVPGEDDNVKIPAGTPECHVDFAFVNSLINEGTIRNRRRASVYIECKSLVSNSGTIEAVRKVGIKGTKAVWNNPGGVIRGYSDMHRGIRVELHSRYEVTNDGVITVEPGSDVTVVGGSVYIETAEYGRVSNSGSISGGDGTPVGDGGHVRIETGRLCNAGHIRSGNGGLEGSKDGTLTVYAGKIKNTGSLKGGRTDGKTLKNSTEITIGNVTLIADSIEIHPDTNYVEADTLRILCRELQVYDVNVLCGIWTKSCAKFFTTADGSADFSGTHEWGAIISNAPDGYNHIYSNNIIAPPEGLNYIFGPAPVTFPADTTIIGGYIGSMFSLGEAGTSDTLRITMQNHSTTSKVLNYSVSSNKGWTSPTSGSTELLPPFEFTDFYANYTIPEGTEAGVEDTVIAILTIGASFADTSYSTITCIGTVQENQPPTIQITAPANHDTADLSYEITWIDSDPEDNALIDLYYDLDTDCEGGIHINTDTVIYEDDPNYYLWNTSELPHGLHCYVYGRIDDETNPPVSDCSDGKLVVDHGWWSRELHFGQSIIFALAWGDYDNDGDVDLAVGGADWGSISEESTPKNFLYSNNGDGTFTEMEAFGDELTFALDWGDCDNDGDIDLAVGNANEDGIQNYLYRNEGSGVFTEIEAFNDGITYGLDWGDYDNDGDLDLIVANWMEGVTTLYRNDGNSEFDSVETFGEAMCVGWQDFDADGNLDFALGRGHYGDTPLSFYKNNGDGTFSITAEFSPDDENTSLDWGDYDNDGDPDLLVGNTESEHDRLYENMGNCVFEEHNVCEMECPKPMTRRMSWGDYDNDGDLDIVWTGLSLLSFMDDTTFVSMSGIVYQNKGDSIFESTAYFGDFVDSFPIEYAIGEWGDYDNDGDLDIAVGRWEWISEVELTGVPNFLYINDVAPDNPNDPPSPSAVLNSELHGQSVTLTWNDGSDPETPTNGLTYNLRIGTTSGGNEILSGIIPVGSGNVGHIFSHTINNLSDDNYYWSVQTVDAGFARSSWAAEQEFMVVGIEEKTQSEIPKTFYLSQNSPNPFITATSFTYGIARAANVLIQIHDCSGRKIRTLVDDTSIIPGHYSVYWNGADDEGQKVTPGVYFCRLKTKEFEDTKKLVLMR